MSVLSDIREGLAGLIRTANIDDSLNVFEYPPDDMSLPAVVVVPSPDTYIDYHGSFGPGRMQSYSFIVRVVVPRAGSAQSGAVLLDQFLSSGASESLGIADVLVGSKTFNSSVCDVLPGNVTNYVYGELQPSSVDAPVPVISAEIAVTVRRMRSTT